MSLSAADRHRVRPRTAALLLASRGVFRLLVVAAPLALAPVWGPTDLGVTVAAIGTFSWIILLGSGAEKTLLKLVPRHPGLARPITSTLLGMVLLPLATAVALSVLGLLTAPSHPLTRLALGLCWSCSLGLLQVTAAVRRVHGRHRQDAVLFGAASAAVLLVTGGALLLSAPPTTWLVAVTAGVLVTATLGLASAWRATDLPQVARPRRVRVLTARSVALLSSTEILSQLLVAAAFVGLQVFGDPTASALFYVAISLAGVLGAALLYLLRLGQPRLSLRYRTVGAAAAVAAGRRTADTGLLTAAAGCVLIGAAALAGAPALSLLVALTVLEVATLAARAVAVNHLENSDGRGPRDAVLASAVGLAAGVLLLPATAVPGGAAGAMALVVGGHVATLVALRLGAATRTTGRATPGGGVLRQE